MYYIGTKEHCEAYNNYVISRQNRKDGRANTKVIEHPNGVDFAVEKHPSVNSPFPQIVGKLNKDWFKKPKKTVKVKESEVEESKVEE
jgi:hypothetical protein